MLERRPPRPMSRRLIVGGLQRTGTLKGGTMKKVPPPVVPELSYRNSGSSFSSGYGSQAAVDRNSCGSLSAEEPVSPPPNSPNSDIYGYGPLPSPTKPSHFCFPDVQSQYTQVIVHAQPNSGGSTPVGNPPDPMGCPSVCHAMLEDQGIDVCPSPGGSSASGTSSRHSMSSVDSGRASGSDKVMPQKPKPHLLSETQHRHSYHSSTSSVSSDDLHIMGGNVAEMMLHGLPVSTFQFLCLFLYSTIIDVWKQPCSIDLADSLPNQSPIYAY
ncbi:hypothetical protein JTE90_007259 [Oedothorax gibbosus]|uniref:Uncharacterized protein n=1 Tax=Oedothorax gibbosus TaxID=931172 RepID=A0AAV6VP60_9ARAC|nr:hypothetical protein JTE90_007259 [Oedothorax gibbosus]